jgi:hypothetical protein
MNQIERLRERYDIAFQAWAEEMGNLHRIHSEAPQAGASNGVAARAGQAELTYRESRDQLAKELCTAGR